MNRSIEKKLLAWKDSDRRKPLILRGARQVGKSWILNEFGRRHFKHVAVCNLDKDEEIRRVFLNKSPQRIVGILEVLWGHKFVPSETLLILDEIQECPNALNALKYFYEEMRELHVVAAGSLLGVILARQSYPVGSVDLLDMYPMDFAEYLEATDEILYNAYMQLPLFEPIEEIFHRRLTDAYHEYLIIGGMPECVALWKETREQALVSDAQKAILAFYEGDFGKHSEEVNAAKCLQVFRSLPAQLAKDNERFIYGLVREGARARDYEDAITWIVTAGLFNKVHNVSKLELPLRVFQQNEAFKLFLLDTGLIKNMASVPNKSILLQDAYQFKGPLAKNYLLEQIVGKFEVEPFYFSDRSSRELDFLLQIGTELIPVEVKGGMNTRAISLKNYMEKRHPAYGIRFSENNFNRNKNLLNLPLYMAARLPEYFKGIM